MKNIIDDVYVVEFAPDGIHYQKDKHGTRSEMWTYFTTDREIREHLLLNPFARFRMRNATTDKTIGILAYDKEQKKFLHLNE